MKYATKYVEVEVSPKGDDGNQLVVFADGTDLLVSAAQFELLFKEASSEAVAEFNKSLGAGRISGKKAKAAK